MTATDWNDLADGMLPSPLITNESGNEHSSDSFSKMVAQGLTKATCSAFLGAGCLKISFCSKATLSVAGSIWPAEKESREIPLKSRNDRTICTDYVCRIDITYHVLWTW